MIGTKKLIYSKAYVELYEIIKYLTTEDKNKIPKTFLDNLQKNMNADYSFSLDLSKSISDQNYMPETKSLYINLYEKYLANEEERDFWKRYNRICINLIENDKRNKSDPDNIFKSKKSVTKSVSNNMSEKVSNKDVAMLEYKEPILKKIKNWLKNLF